MEEFPQCFITKNNYETWVSFAEQDSIDDSPSLSFCAYCTRKYQTVMTVLGRCSNPDTREYEVEDGTEELLNTKA